MVFDQLPYKDQTQQYGSDCWLGKDFLKDFPLN